MGRRLDVLNQNIEKQVIEKKHVDEVSRFSLYHKKLNNGKSLDVQFDSCSKDGTFTTVDKNGVMIVMSSESIADALMFFTERAGRSVLGTNFTVLVDRIDEEKGVCYVKPLKRTKSIRRALDKEIMNDLNAGNTPTVWGLIRDVDRNRALVDICGQGILGYIRVQHWDSSYTRYLDEACKVGDYYQFEITSVMPKISGKDAGYFLSRRNLPSHAWDLIPREYVHEGASIIVKCVDIPEGKSYWWGTSPITPGVEIMGDFAPRRVTVIPGISYKCVVKKLVISDDFAENQFKVIPLAVCKADIETYQKHQKINNKTVEEQHEEDVKKESEELAEEAKRLSEETEKPGVEASAVNTTKKDAAAEKKKTPAKKSSAATKKTAGRVRKATASDDKEG